MIGTWAVLRRQSLVGDGVAHAALPGVCLAFLLWHTRAPVPLMIGAAFTGSLAMAWVKLARDGARVDQNTALGVALTTLFGLGIVLLSAIQNSPDASKAGIDKFLFGQAAALVQSQVIAIAAAGLLALFATLVLYKELKALAFDPIFCQATGMNTTLIDVVQTAALVVAVVIGINTVGVVLMSALLVAPAAAARQWTNKLGPMMILSGLLGGFCGAAGAILSVHISDLPTGPVIVLCLAVVVLLSLLFGSSRGLLTARRRLRGATQ